VVVVWTARAFSSAEELIPDLFTDLIEDLHRLE